MPIPKYNNNKPSETDYAYDSKVIYCKAKLNDKYGQMDIKQFATNFETILKDMDLKWPHKCKDGIPRIPSYKQIVNNWFKQHNWEGCSKTYMDEKLGSQKEEANLIYDKSFLPDTITDYNEIDEYRDLLKKELSQESPDTKELERIVNLIDKTINRIEKRLNRNVQKFEGTVKSDVTVNRLEIVKQKRKELNDLRNNKH